MYVGRGNCFLGKLRADSFDVLVLGNQALIKPDNWGASSLSARTRDSKRTGRNCRRLRSRDPRRANHQFLRNVPSAARRLLPAPPFCLLPRLRQRVADHPPRSGRCTSSFLSTPAIVPTPNSYSREICSNSFPFLLSSPTSRFCSG
jgi:hypothetical protein